MVKEQVESFPPGPRGKPLVGSLPTMQRRGMIDFYTEVWQSYGDLAHLRMGPLHQYLLMQPAYIRHVLVHNVDNYCKGIGFRKLGLTLGNGLFLSEGELWRQQRRLMQPPFTHKGIQQFADDMVWATKQMLTTWQTAAQTGEPLAMDEEMMQLAMQIIGRTMFRTDITAEAHEAADAFTYVLNFVSERSVTLFDIPLFVPTPTNRRFNRSLHFLRTYIDSIIAKRRAAPTAQEDLLTMLLTARDEEHGTTMSEQQLRDEVMTIFFAGHETTAQALTWTWYLLSQHPEVEAELHAELDRVLAGRAPTVADLPNLSYTRMVFQEALRLYPPVLMFVRDAIDWDEIDGYPIPPRSMMVLNPYLMHRHPAFWQQPKQFDPERFRPGTYEERPHYAYFPFGGGRRTCLGDKFALLEGQIVLALVAQRYRLRLLPDHRVEPMMLGTLRPRYGMPMIVEARPGMT